MKKLLIAEKKMTKNAQQTPRPGTLGAKRPVTQKILAYCGGCGRQYNIYPSEMFVFDGESEYKCDRCIKRGK
jgi:hypothetical protein